MVANERGPQERRGEDAADVELPAVCHFVTLMLFSSSEELNLSMCSLCLIFLNKLFILIEFWHRAGSVVFVA